jgi:ectoine hydroxylase-related dioxygenase (phytanoyl-CoA dioxygenase family)
MSDDQDLQTYFESGGSRALALGNRGPIRFGSDGLLHPEVVEAYRETGFYVFEGAIGEVELKELDAGLAGLLERAPATEGASVDRHGRALQSGLPAFQWARPLSDPWGGPALLNGRHPVAMNEFQAAADAPEKAIFLMLGLFESMPEALRLSAHPEMLRVAATLGGADFVPYNDSIFFKEPGLGAAVAWHQDGTTHWDNPSWDPDIHGFNFMAQLAKTTPANGLWVVPGSHRLGHVDIPGLVAENGGSVRLPEAVPMLCERGDIAVCNRQCLHGSFANASPDPRITFVWGFFRRDSVLDAEVDLPMTDPNQKATRRRYREEDLRERQRLVQLAIEARSEHRPDESPYEYAPCLDQAGRYRDEGVRKNALRDYRNGTVFV